MLPTRPSQSHGIYSQTENLKRGSSARGQDGPEPRWHVLWWGSVQNVHRTLHPLPRPWTKDAIEPAAGYMMKYPPHGMSSLYIYFRSAPADTATANLNSTATGNTRWLIQYIREFFYSLSRTTWKLKSRKMVKES